MQPQKWSTGVRMRTQLSLLAALSFVLVLSSILYGGDAPTTLLRVSPHLPFVPPLLNNSSDWSAACPSPRTRSSRGTHRRGWMVHRTSSANGGSGSDGCDLFSGKWVFDNRSYPLYDGGGCTYMSDQVACGKYGRPDLDYLWWRWQPRGCDLKRWNATEMLEKVRGKRVMYVGDSLGRGQWVSMICLLDSVIPEGRKSITPNAELIIFRAEEYNATIEFYWAPLLMESNSDDPVNHRLEHRIIRPDSILKHSSHWEKADVLIFNTYLWWRSSKKIKLLWADEGDWTCEETDGYHALELALETWAEWAASRSASTKRMFFVTMSPTHLWSTEWNEGSDGNCFGEKLPIDREAYWGTGSDIPTMEMVARVLGRLESRVQVLNITQLSEYRKDGHPSIYRKFWETFTPEQLANPVRYSDCIHWCLPGVPDTWNQLLFHLL